MIGVAVPALAVVVVIVCNVRQGSTAAGIVMAKTDDLVAKACWKKGQAVPFKAIAEMFDKVEQTTKRYKPYV